MKKNIKIKKLFENFEDDSSWLKKEISEEEKSEKIVQNKENASN